MVGGIVITTIEGHNRVYINCKGTGCEKRETCAIYVRKNVDAMSVRPGDWLWWQSGKAFWTPADKRFKERELEKVSYSGIKPPAYYGAQRIRD